MKQNLTLTQLSSYIRTYNHSLLIKLEKVKMRKESIIRNISEPWDWYWGHTNWKFLYEEIVSKIFLTVLTNIFTTSYFRESRDNWNKKLLLIIRTTNHSKGRVSLGTTIKGKPIASKCAPHMAYAKAVLRERRFCSRDRQTTLRSVNLNQHRKEEMSSPSLKITCYFLNWFSCVKLSGSNLQL